MSRSGPNINKLKRDILVFAKNQPKDFLLLLKDPALKLNAEIQGILNSDYIQNIVDTSVSKEEAQSKINSFL